VQLPKKGISSLVAYKRSSYKKRGSLIEDGVITKEKKFRANLKKEFSGMKFYEKFAEKKAICKA